MRRAKKKKKRGGGLQSPSVWLRWSLVRGERIEAGLRVTTRWKVVESVEAEEREAADGSFLQQKRCWREAATATGTRKEKVPACSETPAPVGEAVVLAEPLKVPGAMVVALELEVEFPVVASVLFWETTCVDKHMANTITPS